MKEINLNEQNKEVTYDENNIVKLEWWEHIRLRPGMYIGKLGDGSYADDGIYVLLKEVLDNAMDEYMMGYGKNIDITIDQGVVTVRDYGRGIPLGKVVDVSSQMNTGGKYDSKAFKKSVGMNGVGIKAVNALSSYMLVQSFRERESKSVEYSRAQILENRPVEKSSEPNGTLVNFIPDEEIFKGYHFDDKYVEPLLKNY
ncbi:MAG: type IIA DNA topoisomerase subunit B, partial [Bacteroidales bacterium]|nr:type IIA DNA topoisomerase subunit B [Bacteroidales bacterium]